EIEPVYFARAPYSIWKALLRGELDALQAIARRQLEFRGDLEQLARRMKHKGIAERVLAGVDTQVVGEGEKRGSRGLRDDLKKQAMSLSQRALEKLMADENRAMRIANAIGKVQRGRAAFARGQDELMRIFGFASKSDFKAVGKKLSTLKRRIRELEEKVDHLPSSGH